MRARVAARFPDGWPERFEPLPAEQGGNWLFPSNPEKTGEIHFMAVTPDASLLVTGGGRWTRTWSLPDMKLRDIIPASGGTISMDAGGTWLAAGSGKNTGGPACLLNLHDGSPAWPVTWGGGHVALSADGSRLATSSQAETLRVWDTRARQLVHEQKLAGWTSALAISPDGSLVATADGGRHRIYLLGAEDGALRATFEGHRGMIFRMAFSPDGEWLASAAADQAVRLWPVRGEPPPVLELRGHTDHVTDLAFGATRTQLATVSRDGTARLWPLEVAPLKESDWLIPEGPTHRYQFEISPDGSRLLVPARSDQVKWLDLETGTHRFLPEGVIAAEGWSGNDIVTCTADGVLEVHALEPHAVKHHVRLENAGAFTVRRLSPDGSRIAAVNGYTLQLWDTHSGRLLHALKRADEDSACLAWSHDGSLVAVGTYQASIEVFDVSSGHRCWRSPTDSKVRHIAFSPDGTRLAAANFEPDRVVLFDVATGAITGRLTGHMDIVYQCEWSPDGRTLASMSNDRTLRLWHAATQREIARPATDASYERLVFAPDGSFLLHTCDGAKVRKLEAKQP